MDGFTRTLGRSNELAVEITEGPRDRDVGDAVGAWIYVETTGDRNGAYEIEGVSRDGPGRAIIDVGDQTTIRGFVDAEGPEEGYRYIPHEGAEFTIPLGNQWSV